MNHRFTSARRPKTTSALLFLCVTAAVVAGSGLTSVPSAQRPSSVVAGDIVPAWNNTGNSVKPPRQLS